MLHELNCGLAWLVGHLEVVEGRGRDVDLTGRTHDRFARWTLIQPAEACDYFVQRPAGGGFI